MGDICKPVEIPPFSGSPFTGLSSEVDTYNGGSLGCIVPSGIGLNSVLEELASELCTAITNIATIDAELILASNSLTNSFLGAVVAGNPVWTTVGAGELVGNVGGTIGTVDGPDVLSGVIGTTTIATELDILSGATISTAELNYLDGVILPVQDQIDDANLRIGDIQEGLNDSLEDFIVSGFGTITAGGFQVDVAAGTAVAGGRSREITGTSSIVLPANGDSYLYLNEDETIIVQTVANGAPQPVEPNSDTVLISKAVTDGATVITIEDLRIEEPVSERKIQDDAISTFKVQDNAITDDKLSHTGVTPGLYTNTTVEVNEQGRITLISSGVATGGGDNEYRDSVISVETDPLLLSPSVGDRYLIADSAVNGFSGRDGQIAIWDGASYDYIIPENSWTLKTDDDDSFLYHHEGAYTSGVFDWIRQHIVITRTSAQRTGIASPYEGMLIYDSTLKDLFQYTGVSWIPFGARNAHFSKDELPAGETLHVAAGERAFIWGNYTVNGTLDVAVGGVLKFITGGDREIAVYDADGILDNSVAKVEADGRLNIPVFGATPATVNNGDLYATDIAGTTLINFKVGGVIKSVEVS